MRHLLTALAFTLPVSAVGQESAIVGAMSGTLEGVEVSYIIVDGENAGTWWQETDEGIEVSLTAYPSGRPVDVANEVKLAFIAETASRNPALLRGDMTLNRNGETLTATDEAIDIDLESLEVTGNSLLFIGNILATLSAGEESVSVVAEGATTLSADIQATVIRTEAGNTSAGQ